MFASPPKKRSPLAALLCTLGIACVILAAACASTRAQEGAGEYIDDVAITTKVKFAIAQDPQLKLFEINVETFKGRVQLSGFVATPAEADRAVAIARSIKGVNEVANSLQFK